MTSNMLKMKIDTKLVVFRFIASYLRDGSQFCVIADPRLVVSLCGRMVLSGNECDLTRPKTW